MTNVAAINIRNEDLSPEESKFEATLRPSQLAEYIGQTKVKENLRVFMKAALKRREALDHILLTGPPGVGKTTLSNIVANEMGASLKSTSGPVIEKAGDVIPAVAWPRRSCNIGRNPGCQVVRIKVTVRVSHRSCVIH